MIIYLDKIYSDLECWRTKNKITAESQRNGYLVNVMEKFGELSQALRDYEKIKKGGSVTRAGTFDIKSTLGEMTIFEGTTKGELEISLETIEHEIIDALCNIAVLSINAETDIPARKRDTLVDTNLFDFVSLHHLIIDCGNYNRYECNHYFYFNSILKDCVKLCENYGFNFEVAMLEKIRAISSDSGAYNEKANYEKAKIKKNELYTNYGI